MRISFVLLLVFPLVSPAFGAGDGRPAVRVDQAGYPLDAPKFALVAGGAEGDFHVLCASGDGEGATVLFGKLGPPRRDEASGEDLRRADFSALREPGTYRLAVPGAGESPPFPLAADPYGEALLLAARSFYGQRCGTAVDLAPLYPAYRYAACHLEDAAYHRSTGREGRKDSRGGWHDAGDYGKYVVNSGIATGTLLWACEWYPDRIAALDLRIPESSNRTPDLLDEARWNLDWMLTMQEDDGGVFAKVTTERFPGFLMPGEDRWPRYLVGIGDPPYKNTTSAADLAAVAAAAFRLFRDLDPEYAGVCLSAARKAFAWARANPKVPFRNPPGVKTGEYGDGDPSDELLWAAAELFSATGESEYGDYFRENLPKGPLVNPRVPHAWPQVRNLALWAYLFSGREEADRELLARVRRDTLAAAREVRDRTRKAASLTAMLPDNFIWGSNSVAANYGMMLLAAERLEPGGGFRDAALEHLHYLHGRNPFGVCWVTGLGSNPYRNPHHRPSGADANPEPWPGLLAGGPNRHRQDPALKRLPADTPPALCWVDEEESYAGNEVAINWNAPYVFLLAGVRPGGPWNDLAPPPRE